MESYEILWKTALPEIENTVSSLSYDTFIQPIVPVDITGGKLVLCISDKILGSAIQRDPLAEKIRSAITKCSNQITDFVLFYAKDREEYLKLIEEQNIVVSSPAPGGVPLNPKFTFDSYVVGPSNEYLYAAAKAVANAPGEAYNPLFIYGGTGLGKTHILMAIANHLKQTRPSVNVLYSTCEQFTNQFIEMLGKGKGAGAGSDFRNKYRNVDVLLIDDVQFLANKQGFQMEFFHTFNELVMQNKQIVLTSDRPPKEIELLEERLRTRFEGGLIADVQPPDLETRIAILRKKSEEQKCLVDIKVLGYIAETSDKDIRTLIGKLTKVIFASKLHERPITIDLVNEALKESAGERQEELEAEDIINCVCDFFKVNKADILSKKKNKEFVEPRQICMYLLCDMTNLPLVTVGKKLGGRDHTTVIYSRDKVADTIKVDTKYATAINDIRKMLLKQ